jgi:hypothetical protein
MALILVCAAVCAAVAADYSMTKLDDRAPDGHVEIRGVAAGAFDPALWESGVLNWHFDSHAPLIEPKPGGFRNIYAPIVVREDDRWRLYYGAWDGVETAHDRIYTAWTHDFLTIHDRHMVIDHGDFHHVCNCCAIRLPSGEYRLVATALLPGIHNRPVGFTSPDGLTWNGAAPHVAKMGDLLKVDGYEGFAESDINGMNALLFEDGVYRLYFGDFRNFSSVFRASSTDFKQFTFDGPVLDGAYAVNDVKRFDVDGEPWYLMVAHLNGDTLWYSLSSDGMSFDPVHVLTKSQSEADRYMVAVGIVADGERVLGILYGAGASKGLAENRIFAKWLQKRVVFETGAGTWSTGALGLGPDALLLPASEEAAGRFLVYAEDGVSLLHAGDEVTVKPGDVWQIGQD